MRRFQLITDNWPISFGAFCSGIVLVFYFHPAMLAFWLISIVIGLLVDFLYFQWQ